MIINIKVGENITPGILFAIFGLFFIILTRWFSMSREQNLLGFVIGILISASGVLLSTAVYLKRRNLKNLQLKTSR